MISDFGQRIGIRARAGSAEPLCGIGRSEQLAAHGGPPPALQQCGLCQIQGELSHVTSRRDLHVRIARPISVREVATAPRLSIQGGRGSCRAVCFPGSSARQEPRPPIFTIKRDCTQIRPFHDSRLSIVTNIRRLWFRPLGLH